MTSVFATHYSGDWKWILEYTDDFIIYNRSEDALPHSVPRENIGDADYDKLDWLVQNYHSLPEVFVWTKSNLLDKFITKDEWDEVKDNKDFTPLLTKNHKTYSDKYGEVCRYEGDIYLERNDGWYFNSLPPGNFNSWGQWAIEFGLPSPKYIPFAPGGSYILTRERVHRYAKSLYERMRDTLPYSQRPVEAHLCERSYFLLWG